MKFPAHVPAAVRAYITAHIEGDSHGPGWAESLASAERHIAEIDEEIQSCIHWGKDDDLPGLRHDRKKAAEHRDGLAGNVDCLRRLAHDERMRDAFALLTREFTDDKQWRNFIHAAQAARMNFKPYRDRLKRAADLKDEIAGAADALARLIRQFSETGINGPGEFYSIPELLRQTDNHEMQGHNLGMWQAMRRHVLGDLPRRDSPESEQAQGDGDESPEPVIVTRRIVKPAERHAIDPAEQQRNTMRYAWETAPPFSALLKTMANAARNFEPRESGAIGAALEKRENNIGTQYLRAFGKLLNDDRFTLTTPIMKAMAIVATVVINQPDFDVTYEDVRQALAKPSGKRAV